MTRTLVLGHELGKRLPQDKLTALGPYRFGRNPGQQEPGIITEGEFVAEASGHPQRVGAVATNVLFPVAGVGAGQGAQRHRAAHETEIGGRLAGRDKLVHLIGEGEAPLRRWWGFAERLDRTAQIGQGFGNRNQLAALTLHGLFSHVPQTRQGHQGPRRILAFLHGRVATLDDPRSIGEALKGWMTR